MNVTSTAPAAVAAADALHQDPEVAALVDRERVRQIEGAELIASENYTSEAVMAAQGSILTNKYAEGLPRKRYYGGCEFVDQVEQLAIDRLCELFGAAWANVQPHSGASANSAVMLACLKPGDTILGFDLAHGGHLTHGSPVNYSGKLYRPTFYGVEKETGRIDMDKVEATAKKEKEAVRKARYESFGLTYFEAPPLPDGATDADRERLLREDLKALYKR